MAASDLTTIGAVKAWLQPSGQTMSNTDDPVLKRLITQCSRSIMDYLQRASVISQVYTDIDDGLDQSNFYLENWPVTAVSQVVVDARVIPQSPQTIGNPAHSTAGWRLEAWNGYPPGGQQAVEMIGFRFNRGRQNIQITYTAGYLVQNEAQTVPATPFTMTTNQDQGSWVADSGVTYANGTVLTKVTGTPAAGQYALGTNPGDYQFASADQGAQVLISYSYVPGTLEDACINWVSERYRYRGRIGEKTRAIGGNQTASYDLSDIPAYIKTQLQQYRRVLPI